MSMDLYHRRILELAAEGVVEIDNPDGTARIDNPLCGDRVDAQIRLDGDAIEAVGFKVRGCRLCEAAAALMTKGLPKMDLAEWKAFAEQFEAMVRQGGPTPTTLPNSEAFRPVHDYKSRHDCPILPAHAVTAAIAAAQEDRQSD